MLDFVYIFWCIWNFWSDEIQDKSIESLTQFCMLIRSGPAPPKETLQVDYRVKKLLHICIYRVRIFNIYILVLYQLLAKIYFFFFVFLYFLIFFDKTWHTLYGELLVNPTFRLYHLSSFYDSLYQLSASWYWHSKIPVHVDSANCNLNYAPCGVRLKVVGAAMIHKQNS